ncbi:uncharacterized protein [Musca autumnalis]|uniref:uncharacterized protein n=1 Tax=Musca autumnalis TaxID=221902 RepID=UPI003CFB9F1B
MSLELCRLCGNNQNLIKILDRGPEMLEKLKKCANIEIKPDDMLPKLICQQCNNTLDMSMLLRKQSEQMQERLKGELELQKKQSKKLHNSRIVEKTPEDDVQYISDDEPIPNIKKNDSFENDEVLPIDVDVEILETHSESTVVASETEDAVDYDFHIPKITIGGGGDVQEVTGENNNWARQQSVLRAKSLSVDDIDSSESYNSFSRKVSLEGHDEEEDHDDQHYDLIEVTKHEFQHSDSSSSLLQPQESLSIDVMMSPNEAIQTSDNDYIPPRQVSAAATFTCITCNEIFKRKQDYSEHILQHGAKRYQCIQCNAEFPTRYRLVRHESTHNEAELHKCTMCNRTYRAGYNLQRHMLACHSSEKVPFQCNICHLSFARQDVLKRHRDHIHLNLSKKWHCKKCGKSFRAQYLFNAHKTQNTCATNPTTPKPAISDADKEFQTSLTNKYMAKLADDKYKCLICNMVFKCSAYCRTHMNVHTDIKRFPCPTCAKRFRTRYALINHERIHNNEKPFVCDICAKPFRQITHMRHHRMLHARDDLPVKCRECHQGFVTKWKLRDHMRREHCAIKAFKCAECPEEFCLKYDLKRHARLVHLRSVAIADTDNEGDGGTTFVAEGISDSENYQQDTQQNEGEQDAEEHYGDIGTLFNTSGNNVASNGSGNLGGSATDDVVNNETVSVPIGGFTNNNETVNIAANNGFNTLTTNSATGNIVTSPNANITHSPPIHFMNDNGNIVTSINTNATHSPPIHFISDNDVVDIVDNEVAIQNSNNDNNNDDGDDDVQIVEDHPEIVNSNSNYVSLNTVPQTPNNPPPVDERANSPLFFITDLESPPPSPPPPAQLPPPQNSNETAVTATNSNEAATSTSQSHVIDNDTFMDCIQLDDSSNSCKSPPTVPTVILDNDSFDEEEIHITKETYTTSTSYFNTNKVVQQL